ncbi:MAG: DUF177 domain-containing protein [Chloroflexaceae bacterium]|nr:DUF177 domain-containing protein [Chloroflexaceae bacterium]
MTQIKYNVAQLLRELIGARRAYDLYEDQLPLDDTLVLRDIGGRVLFTRTATGVLVHAQVQAMVQLTCVRSLELFDYRVSLDFQEEMHAQIDVTTGVHLPRPSEEDPFFLDEQHMADVGELIREYTLLELPVYPVSVAYAGKPIRYTVESNGLTDESDGQMIDERLAVLKTWSQQQSS